MIKLNSIEDRALSEHTGSALLSKKANGKYSIFLPVEETGENGSTPNLLDKTAIGNRQATGVEGRQENPQKTIPFYLHRDNLNAIEEVEGQVVDFLRLLPDFTGFKYSGTVSKMANSTGSNALEQGQLTITPTTSDVYVENCYPLVEDTVVYTSAIDEVIYLAASSSATNHTKVYNLTTDPADATIAASSASTATATATMGTGADIHKLTITGAAAGSTIVTLTASKSGYNSFKRTILVVVE